MSLKSTILDYLKSEYPRIVHKGEIGRKAVLDWGYENENAGRRCRELENENKIRLYKEKNQASYQWMPPEENVFKRKVILPPDFLKNFPHPFKESKKVETSQKLL